MKVVRALEDFPPDFPECALAIGNFDGMHRGHKAVLQKLRSYALPTVLITFANHPSTILRPDAPVCCLTSSEHRMRLIKEEKIDLLLLLDFTPSFAEQKANDFLSQLRNKIPFRHLVLGHDATMGKDRHGDPSLIQSLAKQMGFTVDYHPEVEWKGEKVSSSIIRAHVEKGDLEQASELLGRPYSLFASVEKGKGLGETIGYHTANLRVSGLCLPPFGVYAVKVCFRGKWHAAIANLGRAPTLHQMREPYLEVHLLDEKIDLYDEFLEVVPLQYIREEKVFENAEELSLQIAQDIAAVKQMNSSSQASS